jgi:hypothetical protein
MTTMKFEQNLIQDLWSMEQSRTRLDSALEGLWGRIKSGDASMCSWWSFIARLD